MNKERKIHIPLWVIYSISAVLLTVILSLAARYIPGFSQWYSTTVYKAFVWVIGNINGIFPFSVGEIILYLLILSAVVGLVLFIVFLIKNKGRRNNVLIGGLKYILTVGSSVFLVYTLFCGINYFRNPFSAEAGLVTEKYYPEEVKRLCLIFIEGANRESENIEKTDINTMRIGNISEMEDNCVKAMNKLALKYPCLEGDYPSPKGVIASEVMCHLNITGVYSPISIEANYNTNAPDYSIPFTVCHELSHLRGFMREDEANYIAFCACLESDSGELKYSGYVQALTYSLNALYSAVDKDTYNEVLGRINDTVMSDIRENSRFWDKYKTPVAEVSTSVNNTYLVVQGQQEGTKTYGRFVDLMLAQLRATE